MVKMDPDLKKRSQVPFCKVAFHLIFRRRLQSRLNEAEQNMEAAQGKVNALEKAKNRLQGELEDVMVDCERVGETLYRTNSTNCKGLPRGQ